MLFGNLDKNIIFIENEFGIRIKVADGNLFIRGNKEMVELVNHLLDILVEMIDTRGYLTFEDVRYAVNM